MNPDGDQSKARQLPVPPEEGSAKSKWRLTKQAFDKLLAAFSTDRDEAGRLYQLMHRKVARYLEWRGADSPEERADETMNRVARKLDEGDQITNLRAFIYAVARHVLDEALRELKKAPDPLDEVPQRLLEKVVSQTDEDDPRLLCFDRCVEALAVENRYLILGYYQEERRAKIQLRQQLANNLQIPLNALRIRAHRIRVSLEECVTKCLQMKTA